VHQVTTDGEPTRPTGLVQKEQISTPVVSGLIYTRTASREVSRTPPLYYPHPPSGISFHKTGKWSVLGSFLGRFPPGHHFLKGRDLFCYERSALSGCSGRFDGYEFSILFHSTGRHLFAFAISYCPPLAQLVTPDAPILGDQFQAFVCIRSRPPVDKSCWTSPKCGSFYGKVPCLYIWDGTFTSTTPFIRDGTFHVPPLFDQPWSQSLFLPENGLLSFFRKIGW